MCYSATASFTTAVLLIPAGTYAVYQSIKINKKYLLLSLIPFFFAIQQAFEGMVWLEISNKNLIIHFYAAGFLFFAYWFWLVWMALSAYAIEGDKHKRIFQIFMVLGFIYGAIIYLPMVFYHYNSLFIHAKQNSIHYQTPALFYVNIPMFVLRLIYVSLIVIPVLMVSNRLIQIWAIVLAITFFIAVYYYEYAFTSIWCYFGAVLALGLSYIAYKMPKK